MRSLDTPPDLGVIKNLEDRLKQVLWDGNDAQSTYSFLRSRAGGYIPSTMRTRESLASLADDTDILFWKEQRCDCVDAVNWHHIFSHLFCYAVIC